ncbi:peptidase S24 [Kosakonia cowanii]|uniref:S24 family peptidase n=1 Tax=Kosakonia cowanii TaxID=208223 RepID=UPI000B961947|nr:S24 family peptidase [Kosakonia cowanii]AST68979.1 peptidase S24 [Kosakonia cowanii]
MQNLALINKPQSQFVSDNMNDFGNRVQSCMMEGDSMQPTIQPGEMIAVADCGGMISQAGIYLFTRDVFGRPCVFVKRVRPMPDGALMIISDNHHYETFTLDADEQSDMRVHGRIIASMTIRRFV